MDFLSRTLLFAVPEGFIAVSLCSCSNCLLVFGCLLQKPRWLQAADKFLVPLPAGWRVHTRAFTCNNIIMGYFCQEPGWSRFSASVFYVTVFNGSIYRQPLGISSEQSAFLGVDWASYCYRCSLWHQHAKAGHPYATFMCTICAETAHIKCIDAWVALHASVACAIVSYKVRG